MFIHLLVFVVKLIWISRVMLYCSLPNRSGFTSKVDRSRLDQPLIPIPRERSKHLGIGVPKIYSASWPPLVQKTNVLSSSTTSRWIYPFCLKISDLIHTVIKQLLNSPYHFKTFTICTIEYKNKTNTLQDPEGFFRSSSRDGCVPISSQKNTSKNKSRELPCEFKCEKVRQVGGDIFVFAEECRWKWSKSVWRDTCWESFVCLCIY